MRIKRDPGLRRVTPIPLDGTAMTSFELNAVGVVPRRACVHASAASRPQRLAGPVTSLRAQSGSACSPSVVPARRQNGRSLQLQGSWNTCGLSRRAPVTAVGSHSGPTPEVEEEEGSALDFPEEYVRAVPSRRPDIFPDLREPKTPMPKPMPGDPEVPDEEEEEIERKKNPGEPGTNPDEDEDEENGRPKKNDEEEEE